MKVRCLLLLVLLQLTACVTPMDSGEVDGLTTCQGSDLKKIRKSLLLNGYEVKSETDRDLVTEFKQISGYGRNRTLQRVTVVKVDEQTYKFRIRMKYVRIEAEHDHAVSVVNRDRHERPTSAVTIDLSEPVEIENEVDQDYYEESRDVYQETQREVCGM